MDYSIWQWVVLGTGCAVTCTLAMIWYLFDGRLEARTDDRIARRKHHIFLFRGEDLSSASHGANTLLAGPSSIPAWHRLRQALMDRFPDFPATPEASHRLGKMVIDPQNPSDPWRILIEPVDNLLRVELTSQNAGPDHQPPRQPTSDDYLKLATDNAPCAIWKTDFDGKVVWHNAAYAKLRQKVQGPDTTDDGDIFGDRLTDREMGVAARHSLTAPGQPEPMWFEVTCLEQNGSRLCYALDIGSLVRAETAQRAFVQTLSKTFAQLSTGLAIFDRQMQLVLFNPALVDLTRLQADFLTMRPNLLTFFDRLRDAQVMPEPKDYTSWRAQMASMVAAANEGNYLETWMLPCGSTYRVAGRPHPDGAVAFLFEDISAEVSLTRRFRADLEVLQNILEELDDAIAVFSATGLLTTTNQAYRDLWHTDPKISFADMTIVDAIRIWQSCAGPSPFWGELRDFVFTRENRAEWTATLHGGDMHNLHCQVYPIQNGSTLLLMRRQEEPAQARAVLSN